jgi:hypothetical protein
MALNRLFQEPGVAGNRRTRLHRAPAGRAGRRPSGCHKLRGRRPRGAASVPGGCRRGGSGHHCEIGPAHPEREGPCRILGSVQSSRRVPLGEGEHLFVARRLVGEPSAEGRTAGAGAGRHEPCGSSRAWRIAGPGDSRLRRRTPGSGGNRFHERSAADRQYRELRAGGAALRMHHAIGLRDGAVVRYVHGLLLRPEGPGVGLHPCP